MTLAHPALSLAYRPRGVGQQHLTNSWVSGFTAKVLIPEWYLTVLVSPQNHHRVTFSIYFPNRELRVEASLGEAVGQQDFPTYAVPHVITDVREGASKNTVGAKVGIGKAY